MRYIRATYEYVYGDVWGGFYGYGADTVPVCYGNGAYLLRSCTVSARERERASERERERARERKRKRAREREREREAGGGGGVRERERERERPEEHHKPGQQPWPAVVWV